MSNYYSTDAKETRTTRGKQKTKKICPQRMQQRPKNPIKKKKTRGTPSKNASNPKGMNSG